MGGYYIKGKEYYKNHKIPSNSKEQLEKARIASSAKRKGFKNELSIFIAELLIDYFHKYGSMDKFMGFNKSQQSRFISQALIRPTLCKDKQFLLYSYFLKYKKLTISPHTIRKNYLEKILEILKN